ASTGGGKPMLWLRRMADSSLQLIAGTEFAGLPFWSPDAKWIGFFSEKQLKKIPAAGGAAQVLASDIYDTFGASWGPGDTILFGSGGGGISQVPAAGG